MTTPVLLNSTSHRKLRINVDPMVNPFPTGRNCSVILQEFQRLCAHYPVVLTKNQETGQFVCVAVFGFDEGENLLQENHRWQVPYIPLNIRRQPFMIGTQTTPDGNEEQVVLVDIEDERLQEKEGQPLFNERGYPAPYMETVTAILKTLQEGFEETADFIAQLLALNLIMPASFKITFQNGDQRQVEGLYTVDQEGLKNLSEQETCELHRKGYLEAAYFMIASLGQVQVLIERRNQRQKHPAA